MLHWLRLLRMWRLTANWSLLFVARKFIFAGGVAIAQPLDRLAANQMLADNLFGVLWLHAAIPDALWIDDHHRAVAALIETAALVDTHLALQPSLSDELLQRFMHAESIAVLAGTPIATGANEHMLLPDQIGDWLLVAHWLYCFRCMVISVDLLIFPFLAQCACLLGESFLLPSIRRSSGSLLSRIVQHVACNAPDGKERKIRKL